MLKLLSTFTRGRVAARRCALENLESRTLFTVPAGFTETRVATGLDQPVAMDFAPDGRLFVTEKTGDVRVIDAAGHLLPDPFLHLTVEDQGERGALGITFDPDFENNRFIYIYYTATTPTIHNRLSRFTADATNPNVVEAGSEQVLMDFDTLSAIYHNSGNLHFGPDGKLYVAVGENVRGVVAQSLDNLWGKIIRLNSNGTIPTDNPFYDQTTGKNRAIWSYGLRNPFTFAFQPGTGRMFINDVGDNTFEEVDEGRAGGNYGWPESEGPTSDPRFDAPIYAYGHTGECNAVTGALFYNPPAGVSQFPSQYVGKYFFGDLCGGMNGGTNGGWIHVMDPTTHAVSEFGTQIQRPVDFDIGPDGSLYYLSNSRPGSVGHVFKVTYTASNAPSISVQPDDVTAPVGRAATFSVEASGPNLSYQWQRDGQDIPGATSSTYTLPAAALADTGSRFRVRVSNGSGSVTSGEATLTVVNDQPPVASITSPAAGTLFSGGETISFVGDATDAEDGALPDSAFTWRVDYVTGGAERPAVPQTSGSRTGSFTATTETPFTGTDVVYRIFLTVTDSAGLTDTTSLDVLPRVGTLTINTEPAGRGLKLALDGQTFRNSTTVESVVGVDRALVAPADGAAQWINGITYVFRGWSDDAVGTSRVVSAAAGPKTVTAIFDAVTGTGRASDPDLTVAIVSPPRQASLLTGSKARMTVRVTNLGQTAVNQPITLSIRGSSDDYVDADDPVIAVPINAATARKNLSLQPGQSRDLKLRFRVADEVPAGDYRLFAHVDAGAVVNESDETNNLASTATPIHFSPRRADLAGSLSAAGLVAGSARTVTASLLLQNLGTAAYKGPVTVMLLASADPTVDLSDQQVTLAPQRVKLKAGGRKVLRLRADLPATLPPGTYSLGAFIDPLGEIAELDESNNLVAGAGTLTIT